MALTLNLPIVRQHACAARHVPLGRHCRRLARCNAVVGDDRGGTSVIERPGLDLSREEGPQTDDNIGAGDRDGQKGTGGGNHRLLLVNSDKHTEVRVVKAVTMVVPGISAEQASNCYHTSTQLGMAIITSCLKEHAEFYSFQLRGRGCQTKIEPDTTTM